MVCVILFVSSVVSAFSAPKIVGGTTVAANWVRDKKKLRVAESNMQLGLNPEESRERARLFEKIGISPAVIGLSSDDAGLSYLNIPAEELPPDAQNLAGEYLLTEEESYLLQLHIDRVGRGSVDVVGDIAWLIEKNHRRISRPDLLRRAREAALAA